MSKERGQARHLVFRETSSNTVTASSSRPVALLWMVIAVVLIALTGQRANAQTFQVIHNFTFDSNRPLDGLTMDAAGNLYGTAPVGGHRDGVCEMYGTGCGIVFKLGRHGSSWIYTPIYYFQGGNDGVSPYGTVVFGPDGALYGTTTGGGTDNAGTVFRMTPPRQNCGTGLCTWSEAVIYTFCPICHNGDGVNPEARVAFDSAGNIFGTTYGGGVPLGYEDSGTVYQLTSSGTGWTETVLYSFFGGQYGDGGDPTSGLLVDQADNLFGTTPYGGGNRDRSYGLVYGMSPAEGGWSYERIYNFFGSGDGDQPAGALISDAAGNLYGGMVYGQQNNGPTIYELSPSNGGWTRTVLYTWAIGEPGVAGSLTMDSAGNFYGATSQWGNGFGSIFKLTHSNGSWIYSTLHIFTGAADGSYPNGGLVIDTSGRLFGTTSYGGIGNTQCDFGCGVIFEITP